MSNDNFSKFQDKLKNMPVKPTLQKVQFISDNTNISGNTENNNAKKRYPGTRQVNVDLDESLFFDLKLRSLKTGNPLRMIVADAIREYLKNSDA